MEIAACFHLQSCEATFGMGKKLRKLSQMHVVINISFVALNCTPEEGLTLCFQIQMMA